MKKAIFIFLLAGSLSLTAQQNREEQTTEIPFTETSGKLLGTTPNPAREFAHIKFQLNTPGRVSIRLYDMLGNPVADLLEEEMPAGTHSVPVNTENFPNGIYFYVLKKDEVSQTMRMVISK